MIHLAIFAVLVLIALILAPWLIAVIVAAAAVYGVYLIGAAIVGVLIIIGAFLWVVFVELGKKDKEPDPIKGARKVCEHCQAEMPAAASKCRNCGSAA